MARYAQVAFNLPLDRTFQYETGSHPIEPGMLVASPFGARRGHQIGCVVGVSDTVDEALADKLERLKAIARVVTPGYAISAELRDLARWIGKHYRCSWGEALACVSLVGFNDVGRQEERWLNLAEPDSTPKLTAKQRLVFELLHETENLPRQPAEIEGLCGVTSAVWKNMLRDGVLREERRPPERPDPYEKAHPPDVPPLETEEQAAAARAIRRSLDDGEAQTFLLQGVTGSGKTEVYLRALEHALSLGRQAIILVPEIALTPQTVGRFRARFGERVGVAHSRLTLGQKLDLWRLIEAGKVDAVIGARSAVFAPLPRLGLIIVDEEHESTYKQSSPAPRYHARDVATVRAQRLGATVVLGSATPSLESQANAHRGKFTLLSMTKRIGTAALPRVELIDMGRELTDALNPSPLSTRMREALRGSLERGEQSIVLLNRRGFAAFVRCAACGHVVQCDHCDVAMTHHRARGKLVCHWCERTKPIPGACPKCEAPDPTPMGLGTQRIEEELRTAFPSARLLRVDLDTTRGKDAFLHHWRAITEGSVDIILGTQMIAKGFDLPRVTFVGVISADQTLFLPDFRASERAFQLITQVAGRAGRADRPGEVLVQTYVPHHYALKFALQHDTEAFYHREMHHRKVLRFPPAQRLASLLFTSAKESSAATGAKRLGSICRTLVHHDALHGKLTVVGPAPAPLARLQDRYRWRLLLRAPQPSTLHRTLDLALTEFTERHGAPGRSFQLTVDVDPLDLL